MEKLTIENCVYIGFFHKTYRYSGTLMLNFESRWRSSLTDVKILITEIEGLPVPWFVSGDGINFTGTNTALIDLQWIEDEKAAKKLCGKKVYLEKRFTKIPENDRLAGDLTGYSVEEVDRGYIGKIMAEDNFSGNQVLTVETSSGTRLIPFHADFVIKTNRRSKVIILKLPEGLL